MMVFGQGIYRSMINKTGVHFECIDTQRSGKRYKIQKPGKLSGFL